jgi:MFS family permease
MTASYTLLADFSTEENRGRLFGLYGVVSGLAMAIAPALGQFVAVNFGYTAFFVATGLLGLVMIPGQIFLKEPPVTTETEPIATVPFWDILRNRWVLISSLGLFSVTMALGALSSFLPLRALQIGLTEMGLYFAAFSLMYMVSGYVAGTLSDKYGRKAVAVPSVLFISLGLLGLTQLGGYLVVY